ncbi:MAG: M1 family aminopeptidase [Vicinamibacterales bacterium]
MTRRPLVLACLVAGAALTVSAQQNRIDLVTPLAPELARYGPLPVGVRTIRATDRDRPQILQITAGGPIVRGDRTLTLEVWYPAASAAASGTDYRTITRDPSIPTTLHGRAARDAAPRQEGAPYPLVIVSHGYPGNRFLMSHLTENLASKGFIVVSIDHPESTYDDQKAFASTLYNRPVDQLFVLDEMARLAEGGSGSFLAGLVDASRTGLVGYSMGGYGVVNVIGGGFSDASAGFDAAPPNRLLAERGASNPAYAAGRDPRIKAAVAIAPWGMERGFWEAEGLRGIRTPVLFVSGSVDDVAGYEKGTRAIWQNARNADRYLLTFDNANHNAAAPIPAPVEAYTEPRGQGSSPFTHYADSVWDTTRMNNILDHFATAFFDWHLKADEPKAQYFITVPHGRDAVWSMNRDGTPTAEHTYWKGFARNTAVGLSLEHLLPGQMPADEPRPAPPTRADILRGEYGRYRANNDLLSYVLDVRVDPDAGRLSGTNTIRFRQLQPDTRIQLELYADLSVDGILFEGAPLTYERDLNTVYVDFPRTLEAGREYSIDFRYSGQPQSRGRFGGITFAKDPAGRPWIFTACEGEGSSIWWPSKDQWRDEPEGMTIRVSVPNGLTDVSNGRFVGQTDLGDGYTRWEWQVHYPINSYNVSLNIGAYTHFTDTAGARTLDFYVLPESLEKARRQFAQARPMIAAFEKFFGEYPFVEDGYKLIEVPYSGMEHQSAVTYGNHFANGYLERDWTGVGISPRFDFIIIHESAHEWFGNAVSAADVADMWIHEGWATYLEALYVEELFGPGDALTYINGYKDKVKNLEPIVTQRGIHRSPQQDMYFKGALMLHTLRGVVGDDAQWFALIKGLYQRFKYRNIATEDVVAYVNETTGRDLTPFFNQYLRRAALPVLQVRITGDRLAYRWQAEERGFDMPIRVGAPGRWQTIQPTTDWQVMPVPAGGAVGVDTDHFYVDVDVTERATDGSRP